MFYVIEYKPERSRIAYTRLRHELQRNFTKRFNISVNESDFERFMQTAFEIVRNGNKADWGILTGTSFAMTSLTTIGYGHITPETQLGQFFTVIYCIVGLPLSTLALKSIGELIAKMVYKIVYRVETKLLFRIRPRKVKIKTFFITFTLMILTLCIGALAGKYLEGWTFIEGFYAWFASLSTIGYGDYVPGWKILKNAEDSAADIWILITALSLPGMATLCVVSGVVNSLVEAYNEFKIQCNVCSRCPACRRRKSEKSKGKRKKKKSAGGETQEKHRNVESLYACSESERSTTV